MTPPFTEADVALWREAMREHAPSLAGVEAADLPMVAGLALRADPAGLALCLRTADGSQIACALNPVVARMLAIATLGEGQRAGWITEGRYALAIPGTDIEP